MKSFGQFISEAHSLKTLADILQRVERPGSPAERDVAVTMARKYATYHPSYEVNVNDPKTFQAVYDAVDKTPTNFSSVHPYDAFLAGIKIAALRHGFENSESSHYIIHDQGKGYLGQIFYNSKFRKIGLAVPSRVQYSNEELKPFWVITHHDWSRSSPEVLGRGDTVQSFETFIRGADLAQIDADARAAKAERERPKHAESNDVQKEVGKVLKDRGFTLDPPNAAGQKHQTWWSADRQRRVYVFEGGSWDVYTIVGGLSKKESLVKKKSPDDLALFLDKNASKEPQAHQHPVMDKIIKYLDANGFRKSNTNKGFGSATTLNYVNDGANLHVELGRENFFAKGRITPNEEIIWKINAGRYSDTRVPFTKGTTYESFLETISKMATFEKGPEAMGKLIKKFQFKPMELSKVADQFRDASYDWFRCGSKVLSRGTIVVYYLGYHKNTGHYRYVSSGLMNKDWLELEGTDIATLTKRLNRDGFNES